MAEPGTSAGAQREPFKGLRPYEESDQEFFFGRDAERRILIDKILTNRLTLLFAATGVGKSSLLQAAVVPHLKDARHENLVVVVYNDWVTPPLEGLKTRILDTLREGEYLAGDTPVSNFGEQSLPEFFRLAALFGRPPLVVILDQFEELFRYQRQAEQFEPFVRQLSAAIADQESPIAFVISMREDFALELNAFRPYLSTILFEDYYRLERLTPENAEKAIVEPLRRVGFAIEDALLGDLRQHLVQRDEVGGFTTPLAGWVDKVAPPYLQIVCSQLWELESQNPDKILRLETYRNGGEARGLLGNYVERTLKRFSAEEKLLASRAFDHLVTRHGTKMAYTARELAKTVGTDTEPMEKVLGKLDRARILRSQQRKKVVWFELYHDLFSPIVEAWNDRFKADRRVKQTITWTGIVFTILAVLFVAYDVVINLTSYHYRMSFRPDDDRVELYRGAAGSRDFLGLQKFVAETDFRRSQLEPDKREREKRKRGSESVRDLIGELPFEQRIHEFWNAGLVEDALRLVLHATSEDGSERSLQAISQVGALGSLEFVALIEDELSRQPEPNEPQCRELVHALADAGVARSTGALTNALAREEMRQATRLEVAAALAPARVPETLDLLVDMAESADSESRLQSVKALRHWGSDALQTLSDRLEDSNEEVQLEAARSLVLINNPTTIPVLIDLLDHPGFKVRSLAADGLGRLGDLEAVPPLNQRLGDRHGNALMRAVMALGRLGDDRAIQPLVSGWMDRPGSSSGEEEVWIDSLGQLGHQEVTTTLLDETRLVTLRLSREERRNYLYSAVEALGPLGDSRAIAPLVRHLMDVESHSLSNAASALGTLGSPLAIQPLLDRLTDSNSWRRRRVLEALGELRSHEATEALVRELDSTSLSFRCSAALALTRLGGSLAAQAWSEHLQAQNLLDCAEAFEAIRHLESLPIDPLITMLEGLDPEPRCRVLHSLGQLGDSRALDPLIEALGAQEARVRACAAEALGSLGSSEAIQPLLDNLNHYQDRGVVARALGQLQSVESLPHSVSLLGDQDPSIQAAAMEALGLLRSTRASLHLERRLGTESAWRAAAALALGEIGSRESIEPLLGTLSHRESTNRTHAATALGRLRGRRTTRALIQAWESEEGLRDEFYSGSTRAAIIQALGELEAREALSTLLEALEDPDGSVRTAAYRSLGRLGDRAAVGPLIQRLRVASYLDRSEALLALSRLGGPEALAAISEVYDRPYEVPKVRIAAAIGLLALGSDEGLQFLQSTVDSSVGALRLEVARILSEIRVDSSFELLDPLIEDPVFETKLLVLGALGMSGDGRAADTVHTKLGHDDGRIRRAAAQAIVSAASPDSIPEIRAALTDRPTDIGTNLHLLDALAAIGTNEAIKTLLTAVQENEQIVGLRVYQLLGDLRAQLGDQRDAVLAWLDRRLEEVTHSTRVWRAQRDTRQRDFSDEALEQWEQELESLTPEWHWAFELAYSTARIDPEGRGVELLSHELADVRHGAWIGIGAVGSVELIERLDAMRAEDDRYPFHDAAYRAIDHALRRLEGTATDEELAALRELLPRVHDKQAVCTRMEWTIHRIDREAPLLEGGCQINWREAS